MIRDVRATQVLHDWWQSMRGDRAMPTRVELDPVALKTILPDLLIFDVAPAASGPGHIFSCRLAGTEIDSRFGFRLTGLTLEQVPIGAARTLIQQQYETAVAEARPVFCSHSLMLGDRYVEYDRMVVPLSGQAQAVKSLAAAIDFKCAYRLSEGRPLSCTHPQHCDRIDRCIAKTPLP